MKDAIDTFLRFVYAARSEKTRDTYKAVLKKFVDVVGEDAPLTKDTYIKFLLATSGVSKATQALYRSTIRRLYKYQAATVGGVDTSFFEITDDEYGLKRPKSFINPDMDGIRKTIEYVNTTRSTPEELRDRAFILLLADSGLRVSEACSLEVAALDMWEENVFVMGKGDKPAVVKISHRTANALADYFKVRPGPISKSQPVFIRHDKRAHGIKPITSNYIWHYVKRRIKEAGVDPSTIRIHDFRHFFVTTVYRAKGIKTAQVWARHESIATTNHYTHLVDDGGEAYDDVFNH